MITLSLYFIALPVGVFIILRLFRVKSKKILLGIPIFIFCFPFLFGTSLYLFRAPIQQGKFLADFGPILSWVFPAEDLYDALAEETLRPDQNTYLFTILHKYVGKHAVKIEIPSDKQAEWTRETGLKLLIEINDSNNTLFQESADQGLFYRGREKYGYYYVEYKVPGDVPVAKILTIKIKIAGDINAFLSHHRGAKVIVQKTSDE